MNRMFLPRAPASLALGALTGLLAALILGSAAAALRSQGEGKTPGQGPEGAALKAELDALKELLPDQAHAMADVGQHFTNLWLAAREKNWAVASFYLGETRSHLRWAVRIKPVRKSSAGQEVNLVGILEAVENTFFTELQKQIEAQNEEKFAAAYRLTLEGCYSCHKASEKAYLRLQVPQSLETPIINFDPKATWPE